MPLYEYECRRCGRRTEVIQRFSDDPLTTCEQCGGELKKMISAPAVQFKGTGWYVTDYARKGQAAGATTGGGQGKSEPKSDTEGGTDGTSESGSGSKKDSAGVSGSGSGASGEKAD